MKNKKLDQMHPLNCGTCKNIHCDLYDLEEVAKNRILEMGRVMLMRSHSEIYGCASHSSGEEFFKRV